ncbi:MAG: hypothetical protein Q9219_001994 [cf. Caloplaca sp. 3 TL-2023]
MKYGETLQQRSIPEWENYNVDYNDLKRLIKVRTTRGQGEALTIPGHENEARSLRAFEDEFFAELADQHERVNLFVQSKAGEINRRLIHLDRQIGQLQHRYPSYQHQNVSVKCLERFARAEEAVEKAGEDIRSLARFVGAQKLAFVKILKKYKKWTASTALESRFRPQLLNQPTSFSKRDFQPLLTHYTNVLAAVRAPFDQDGKMKNSKKGARYQPSTRNGTIPESHMGPQQQTIQPTHGKRPTPQSTAAKIQAACRHLSGVEFDSALATLPLGISGAMASYWVHPDNLVELHVLLLQYTRLRRTIDPETADLAMDRSGSQSRRTSMDGNGSCLVSGGDEEVGLVVCDDLKEFACRQSGVSISDVEESVGTVMEKAAVAIRYSSDGEALVAVKTSSSDTEASEDSETFQDLLVKKKAVRHLFNSGESGPEAIGLVREQSSEGGDKLDLIQRWLHGHREIRPLVELRSKRTRFVGLKKEESSGSWATLDRDIQMRKTPDEFFHSKEKDLAFDGSRACDYESFPFAILEVRLEGSSGAEFLAALDESHLTERIRGFSMETHAVATLCKPPDLPHPYWLPTLDQDLRKIPATVKTASSRRPNTQSSPSASVGNTSVSAASTGDHHRSSDFSGNAVDSSATSVPDIPDIPESPARRASKNKRKPEKDRAFHPQVAASRRINNQRYWNEYDDGDENSDNEPFVVYIDPQKSASFPGFAAVYEAMSSMASKAKTSSKKVRLWLPSLDQRPRDNRVSRDSEAPGTPEDDSDLDDDSPTDPLLYRNQNARRYSTFPNRRRIDHAFQARERLLARCCIACFVASVILLLVAALLASAGRRKAIFKVDVGVIVGAVFSLIFAVAGVGCMFKRREYLGFVQRAIVFSALAVVCVGAGVLLAGVVGA